MKPRYYRTRHVAEELDVSVRTVERWRASGKLVPKRRTEGGHSLYSREQVCRFKTKQFLEQLM